MGVSFWTRERGNWGWSLPQGPKGISAAPKGFQDGLKGTHPLCFEERALALAPTNPPIASPVQLAYNHNQTEFIINENVQSLRFRSASSPPKHPNRNSIRSCLQLQGSIANQVEKFHPNILIGTKFDS